MRKLLLFIIPIFILACSEDKDVKVYKPASTISTRSGTWSIAGGKDTYVLGERLGFVYLMAVIFHLIYIVLY